jgi:hypothetical protein
VNARATRKVSGTRIHAHLIPTRRPSVTKNRQAATALTITSTAADELAGLANQASR